MKAPCALCGRPVGRRGRMIDVRYDLELEHDCPGCRWLQGLIRTHGPGAVYHDRCFDEDEARFKLTESPPPARPGEGEDVQEPGGGGVHG